MSVVLTEEAVHTNALIWQAAIDVSAPMELQAVMEVSKGYVCYQ